MNDQAIEELRELLGGSRVVPEPTIRVVSGERDYSAMEADSLALGRRMRVEFELRTVLTTELLSAISGGALMGYVGGGRAFGGLTREDRLLAAGMVWNRVKRNTTPLEESMLVAKYTALALTKKTNMESYSLKRKILAVEAVCSVAYREAWVDVDFDELAFSVASWADLKMPWPEGLNYWKNRKKRLELISKLRERNNSVLNRLYLVLFGDAA